eukprot:9179305-Karenia_brevis.AAC.1
MDEDSITVITKRPPACAKENQPGMANDAEEPEVIEIDVAQDESGAEKERPTVITLFPGKEAK